MNRVDSLQVGTDDLPTAKIVSDRPTTPANTAETNLPPPPHLFSRRVIGPSAVFTALAIGSGELIFWPGLSLSYGAGVLWIALLAVGFQYLVNIEIGRYSLATGESVIIGANRLWNGWGIILLLGTVIPWIWPGWARAAAQVIQNNYGIPEKTVTIISLLLCGLLLAFPAKVYSLLEWLQSALLVFILLGVLILFVLVLALTPEPSTYFVSFFSGKGLVNLLKTSFEARNNDFLSLLSGIVFAGAGGILNLGYGLLICEKKFGMGAYAQEIVGLRHSLGLGSTERNKTKLLSDPDTVSKWKEWLALLRKEHALLFLLGNSFTIVFLSFIFFCLLGELGNLQGMTFLQAGIGSLNNGSGTLASTLLVWVAIVILFTSEIGILDITSRLATGIVHETVRGATWNPSKTYHGIVWTEITLGCILTIVDPRQPYWFLVTSAVLNTLVMAVYTGLTATLNNKGLPEMARPNWAINAVMWIFVVVNLALFGATIIRVF